MFLASLCPKPEQMSQLQLFLNTGHLQTYPWFPIALVMLPLYYGCSLMHNPHPQFGLRNPPITNFMSFMRVISSEKLNKKWKIIKFKDLNVSSLPVQCGYPIVSQFVYYGCCHQRITEETK